MTLTVLQYKRVHEISGEPIEPPETYNADVPLGAAFALKASTSIVRVIAVAACYLRASYAGTAATNDDLPLAAGASVALRVRPEEGLGTPVSIYGLTSA